MAKPNPIVRAWKYMSAWFGNKVDEKADPKIQIQQATQEAQHQHQALTQQAADVIGNQRQLEMQLDRQLDQVEALQAQARQALVLADKARADGDVQKAGEFEQTAQMLANQLVDGRVVDRGPEEDARRSRCRRPARRGRPFRTARPAAAATGRAHQAAHPARAGQDAGVGLRSRWPR